MSTKPMERAAPTGYEQPQSTDVQTAGFRRTRDDHRSELAEDYVELIAELIETIGEARTTDLASRLGVSHATATKTVARLKRDGLVRRQAYRAIFLTPGGQKLADAVRRRHRIVLGFLTALGVSPQAAELDAEGIEHHVGEETLAAFERFVAAKSRA